MKLSAVIPITLATIALVALTSPSLTSPQTMYLLRIAEAGNAEQRYWVLDLNGGALQKGDEVEVYYYNEAIAIGASKRFQTSWAPEAMQNFELSKLRSDNKVFDGSLLNVNSGGKYELRPLVSKYRAPISTHSLAVN